MDVGGLDSKAALEAFIRQVVDRLLGASLRRIANLAGIQFGIATVGTSGAQVVTVSPTFPTAFASGVTPKVLCTPLGANFNDSFTTTVRGTPTNTGFTVNVCRTDVAATGWSQTLQLLWVALV